MLRCHVALWALPSKDCCHLLSPDTKPGLTKTPFCFFESKEDRLVAMLCFQCVFFSLFFCFLVVFFYYLFAFHRFLDFSRVSQLFQHIFNLFSSFFYTGHHLLTVFFKVV